MVIVCACFYVENGALASATQPASKPTKASAEVSGEDEPVPTAEEMRQLRNKVKELREALDRLQSRSDRRVKQLQEELDDEKSARQQLVSDVDRLKKIVATKLCAF